MKNDKKHSYFFRSDIPFTESIFINPQMNKQQTELKTKIELWRLLYKSITSVVF